MTTLRNLTAHPVVLVGENGSIQLPGCSSPPRICHEIVRSSSVTVDQLDIPVRDITAGRISGLPEPLDDVLLIVPRIVAAACPDRPDLVVPYEDVRDHDGHVIGCRALARLVADGG